MPDDRQVPPVAKCEICEQRHLPGSPCPIGRDAPDKEKAPE